MLKNEEQMSILTQGKWQNFEWSDLFLMLQANKTVVVLYDLSDQNKVLLQTAEYFERMQ